MNLQSFHFPLFFCVTLIILNTVDVITTLYGFKIGLSESNPFFPRQYIAAKIMLPIFYSIMLSVTYSLCQKYKISLALWFLRCNLIALNIFYAFVVCWNLYLILKVL